MDAFLVGAAIALTGRPRVVVPGVGWLAPVGVRSYGLYLWHVPILFLFYEDVPVWLLVLASFGAAVLSWRYVERPTRRGALTSLEAQAQDQVLERIRPRIAAGQRDVVQE